MVLTEHPAVTGQDILIQLTSRLILPQTAQVGGKIARRCQGLGVVVPSTRR